MTYSDYLMDYARKTGELAFVRGLSPFGKYRKSYWARPVGEESFTSEGRAGTMTETPWGSRFAYQAGYRPPQLETQQGAIETGYTRKKRRWGRVKRKETTTGGILVEKRYDPMSKDWITSKRQVFSSDPSAQRWIAPGYGTWHRLVRGGPAVETPSAKRARMRAMARPELAQLQFGAYGLQAPKRLRPEEQAITFMTSGSDLISGPGPG